MIIDTDKEIEILQTPVYANWIDNLKDKTAQKLIDLNINKVKIGNYGNVKSIGDKVFELKIDYAKGYRVYFSEHKNTIIILLFGGDKSKQQKDINRAKQILKEIKEEDYEIN